MRRSVLVATMALAMAALAPATIASGADVEFDCGATSENALSAAQLWKAETIAAYFAGEDPSDEAVENALALVIALRTEEPSMGWGVLSKLAAYAAAGMTIDEFMVVASDDGGGYALGQLRKDYLQGVEDGLYEELPYKNLGQMQKAEKPAKPHKTPPGHAKKTGG
ncbi:MAG: hypothetical protein WBN35_10325 [Acidimicrobiia bacterium]